MMLPPYARTMGIAIEDDAGGRRLVMPYADHLLGRPGFIHGGALAGLLEMAAIVVLRDALGPEDAARLTPVTVTVDFRRSGLLVETRAAATIIRLGRRIANVDAEAWQDDPAKPVASARLNISIDREAPAPDRTGRLIERPA